MPKFEKQLLPEGKYLVTMSGGRRTLKDFSSDQLHTIADTTNKMIDAGLNIPAPFKHVAEAVPVDERVETNSFQNAGYWDSVKVETVDGKAVLCGVIDAPGDKKDFDSPAGKLQNTIKEVSVCVQDSWTDGAGREWGPCMLHAAPVLHPVVPGQKDGFTIREDAFALSASGILESPTPQNVGELAAALEDSVGIYIPPATMPEDLVKVLLVSLKQHKLTADTVVEDQEIVDTQSIFMSHPEGSKMPLTKKLADELVALGAINPKTEKPFTLDDVDIQESDPTEVYALALTKELVQTKKADLSRRIDALVATKRTTKEHADASLRPELEKYSLSLGENASFKEGDLDRLVVSLEALPGQKPVPTASFLSSDLPSGAIPVEGDPQPGELSEAEAASMLENFMKV